MIKVEIHNNANILLRTGRSTITTLLDALGSVWFEYKLFLRIPGLISQLSDTSMFSDLEEFLFYQIEAILKLGFTTYEKFN